MTDYEMYNVRLETLSPLHIGSGNVLTVFDYYYDEKLKKAVIIDFNKLLELPEVKEGDPKFDYLTKKIEENISNTQARYTLKEYLKDRGIDANKLNPSYIDAGGHLIRNRFQINEFAKSVGRFFIPGSSIKGAIRTALFYSNVNRSELSKFIQGLQKRKDSGGKTIIFDSINRKTVKREFLDEYLEGLVFGLDKRGKKNPCYDVLRSFIFSDSSIIDLKYFKVIKAASFDVNKNEKLLDITLEAFKEKLALQLNLKLDKKLFKAEELNFKEDFGVIGNIVKACNEHSKALINFELKKLRSTKLKEFYQNLLQKISRLSQNECILRIGRGSGFFGNTLCLLLEEGELMKIREFFNIGYSKKGRNFPERFPITRIVELDQNEGPIQPLGWVKLSFEENE